MKVLVQSDFDGTITKEDVSFMLLDAFADGDWRPLLKLYLERKISVGYLNTTAFSMIKGDKQMLLDYIKGRVKIRDGFYKLLDLCRRKSYQFVIVSNGLDFYIEAILKELGLEEIKVYAAETRFHPKGMEAIYIGPEGNRLEEGFKDAYIRSFIRDNYRVIYIGNGFSDFVPAKEAYHIFATDELLNSCKEMNWPCTPFTDLKDVVRVLETLPVEAASI